MKETLMFWLGAGATLIFMKMTATVVHFGNQDLICYIMNNPFK